MSLTDVPLDSRFQCLQGNNLTNLEALTDSVILIIEISNANLCIDCKSCMAKLQEAKVWQNSQHRRST